MGLTWQGDKVSRGLNRVSSLPHGLRGPQFLARSAETNKSVVLPPFNLVEKYLHHNFSVCLSRFDLGGTCLWFDLGATSCRSVCDHYSDNELI